MPQSKCNKLHFQFEKIQIENQYIDSNTMRYYNEMYWVWEKVRGVFPAR